MAEAEFNSEIVRTELIRKVPEALAAGFDGAASKKGKAAKQPPKEETWLCGYNAAGQLVARLGGGGDLRMMTTTGWQDGTEGARLAEEMRLLRQAIAPSGKNFRP